MFPLAPPPNHHVQFALKLSVRFYPPSEIAKSDLPSNRQVQFTPQIVCTIYPPQIAKSDLPSNNQVQFTPQIVCTIYPPQNRQVRFTLKLPSPIYPQIAKSDLPLRLSVRVTPFPPPNCQVPFTIICMIYPQIVCMATNFTSLGISNGL